MHAEDGARENVAEALLRYLRGHPDAADTLEGVVKWWLPRQRYLDASERVEAALELLVQREMVEKLSGPSGIVYRCLRLRVPRPARISRH